MSLKATFGLLTYCSLKREVSVRAVKEFLLCGRAVVSGGAGGALASPEFGSSLIPILARGGRLYPPHYW